MKECSACDNVTWQNLINDVPRNSSALDSAIGSIFMLLVVFICTTSGLTIAGFSRLRQQLIDTNRARQPHMLLLMSLAVSDFILGVFLVFHALLFFIPGLKCWPALCLLRYATSEIPASTSVLTVCLIGIDRFIEVTRKPLYLTIVTETRVKVALAIVWVAMLLLTLLPVCEGIHLFQECPYCMYEYIRPGWFRITIISILMISFYILVLCYSMIVMTIHCRQSAVDYTTKRVTTVVSVVIATFICCWLPYTIIEIVILDHGINKLNINISLCFITLGFLNSFMNFFIYSWGNTQFRTEVKHIVTDCFCRPNAAQNSHNEIAEMS